jgi:hypothetical protein
MEAVMFLIDVLLQNLHSGNGGDPRKASGWPVSRLRFEPDGFLIQIRSKDSQVKTQLSIMDIYFI